MTADVAVPEVEFAGVSKSYAGRAVLDAMDLRIAKGEFVTLIGPSGCGKSTVLKLISGLTAASGGTIRVDGMTPRNARQTMSYIFQDATLLPWRTVRQNVGLGLELEGVVTKQREEKTAALLDLVGPEPRGQGLSAGTLRGHEDARLDRARSGHQPAPAPDGRALCGIG